MKTTAIAVMAAVVCLSGCGGTGRMLSYGTEMADAKVLLGAAEYQIYVHPTGDTLLIQRSLKQIAGGHDNPMEFTAAASQFLAPAACAAGPARLIASGSFETTFACPAGVELYPLVMSQRARLRTGEPLRGQ